MADSNATYVPATPLGELFRIGDIIEQELPMNQCRKVCYLKSGQGAIAKGQALAGDFTKGDTTNGDLSKLAADGNEIQTVIVASAEASGTFSLTAVKYDGTVVNTGVINYIDSAGTIQAALNTVLGASACSVVLTNAGSASTPMVFVVTFDGTNYARQSQPLLRVDVVSGVAYDASTVGSVARTGSLAATCISLQTVATGASAGTKILCLVRQAMVKPGYVGRDSSGTALSAGEKRQLELNSGIIVLAGPTYGVNPDVNKTETVSTSTTGLAGL